MADPASEPTKPTDEILCGARTRKEKRKILKKLKRKQIRREAAIREREKEEARLNDPEEQLRIKLKEQEDAKTAERERKEFEERERLWLEAAAKRKAEEEERRKKEILDESDRKKNVQAGPVGGVEEDGEYEDVEVKPGDIIWQGNEIILKKKRVKVSKKSVDRKTDEEEVNRPTSNPLPPQSSAFASYNSAQLATAQELLEDVAHQVPNFGTEQDKAHCPFHLKTGACRFGTRCSRVHFIPDKSCTLLIKNMYNGPGLAWEQDEGLEYTDEEIERCYEEFYEDVHTEFLTFGELVNFKVCKNGSYHLRGNVYVHYKSLESAVLAYNTMNGRYFAGKRITCEYISLTRWKVAICGEYMKSRLRTCSHGTACNFIHCFRNPRGEYEWADWDNPPPKYWIKKMAHLFGRSDDSGFDEQIEPRSSERQRDSSRKRTSVGRRYHSRSDYKAEVHDSGSGREDSDKEWDRHLVGRGLSRSRRSHDDKMEVSDNGSGGKDSDTGRDKLRRRSAGREHSRTRRSVDDKREVHEIGCAKEYLYSRSAKHRRLLKRTGRSPDDKMEVHESYSGRKVTDGRDRYRRHSVRREHARNTTFPVDKMEMHETGSGREDSHSRDGHRRSSAGSKHSSKIRRLNDENMKVHECDYDSEDSDDRMDRHSGHTVRTTHIREPKETNLLEKSKKHIRNHKSEAQEHDSKYAPLGCDPGEERSKDSELSEKRQIHERNNRHEGQHRTKHEFSSWQKGKEAYKEQGNSERELSGKTHKGQMKDLRIYLQLSGNTDDSRNQSNSASSEDYYLRHGMDAKDRYGGRYCSDDSDSARCFSSQSRSQHKRQGSERPDRSQSHYRTSCTTYDNEWDDKKVIKQEAATDSSSESRGRWETTDRNTDVKENRVHSGNRSGQSCRKHSKSSGKLRHHQKRRKPEVAVSGPDEELNKGT